MRISTTKCPCGAPRSYHSYSERGRYNFYQCNNSTRCGLIVKTLRPRTRTERLEEHYNGRNKRGKRLV